MELELGLKLTRAADEFTSDFQIAKDRAGPVFLSRETDAMFILTAHLKGYKRRNIKIDINEDGSLIGIGGERQVKETVMVGWNVYKKTDTKIQSFKKVFRIPDGVILDKIKAKFNEDESTLTITMPKKVKGIRGAPIEEVKESRELVKQGSGNLQIVDEMSSQTGISSQAKDEKLKAKIGEDKDDEAGATPKEGGTEMPKEEIPEEKPAYTEDNAQRVDDLKDGEEGQPISPSIRDRVETETAKEDEEDQEKVDEKKEKAETKHGQELDGVESLKQLPKQDLQGTVDQVPEKADDVYKAEEKSDEQKEGPLVAEAPGEAAEAEPGKVEEAEHRPRGKRCKMCIPIVAGSTLLLSFVVFFIQIIRSKSQTSRRRD